MNNLSFVIILPLAIAAYQLRCRTRYWYGVVEIVAASASAYLLFNPPRSVLLLAEQPAILGAASSTLSGLVCIYIFVRGLDNMHRGAKRTRPYFDRWFGQPS